MAKLTLSDPTNLINSSAIATLAAAHRAIETAMENTLSRDGTSPNEMLADLDMNSNRIINLVAATATTEPVRKAEFDAAVFTIIHSDSTTSNTIGTGSKTFTVDSGLAFAAGMYVQAIDAANSANYMIGQVTSYSGTTLVIDVTTTGGSGTKTDWDIYLSGPAGQTGPTGPQGPSVSDGDKGDITVSGSGATWTIDNGVVSLAKMADMATDSFLGRDTAGTGAPEVLSVATVKTLLSLTGTNSGDQTITLTGDVTGSGTGSFATTIANSAVTLAKMADMATDSFLGRDTAGTGAPEVLSVATAKTLLGISGSNTGDQTITLTGDVTGSGTGSFAATIAAGAVSLSKMANMATASFLGRESVGSGAPEVLSLATVKAMLDLTGTNSGDQTITLTGDVTGSGTGSFAATIAAGSVTLAKMADMATDSFLGRDTAGTGAPEVLSVATVKTLLGLTGTNSGDQTITLTGDVTGSGTGSFAATIANDSVTYAKLQNVSATNRFLGRITAAAGDAEELTGTQATTLLDVFTDLLQGVVPASGGGTTNYLRADGTWAAPPGGGGGGTPGGSDTQVQFNDATAFGGDAGFTYNKTTDFATLAGGLIGPVIAGGTGAASTLTLESTTGAGTTDQISFKTGSQSERLRIDTSGYITNNGTAVLSYAWWGNKAGTTLYSLPSSTDRGDISLQRYTADNSGPNLLFSKSRGTTAGSLTTTVDGDNVGWLGFFASDGGFLEWVASISVSVDGTPVNGVGVPGRIAFSTTPSNSADAVERLRIDNAGRITTTGFAHQVIDGFDSKVTIFNPANTFGFSIVGYNNDPANLSFSRVNGATPTTYTAVASGNKIMEIDYYGADGTSLNWSGAFIHAVDGTVSTGVVPSRFEFHAGNAAGSVAERLRIDSYGASITGTTLTNAANPVLNITQTWNGAAIATTGASGDGTTATITFAAQAPKFTVGSSVTVAGVTPAGYNGTFTVTASTSTSVSYLNATTGAQTVAGTVQTASPFTGILANFTNTVSPVGSKAVDIQVDGSSVFTIDSTGTLTNYGNYRSTEFILVGDGQANTAEVDFLGSCINSVNPNTRWAFAAQGYANNTGGFNALVFSKTRNAQADLHTIVASGDTIGAIRFYGSDGTTFRNAARIEAIVDGTPGAGDMPGRLVFSTTPDGSTTITERMRIDSAGTVTFTNGSTNTVLLGQGSGGDLHYNILSFNGVLTGTGWCGIEGGGSTDKNLYHNVDTGGRHSFSIAETEYFGVGVASGVKVKSTLPLAFGTDLFLTRPAAATLQQGNFDAAAPVAQTTTVQSVVAGTTDTAGVDWTFQGSRGTGTGAGGNILFKTADVGSTGTAQNSAAERLRVGSNGDITYGTFATTQYLWDTSSTALVLGGAGATAALNKFDTDTAIRLQVLGADFATGIGTARFANSTGAPKIFLGKSRGTTVGDYTIVQSGDGLGEISWQGANGTGLQTAAQITAAVDGTPGASGDMPGRLVFSTVPDGSGTPTERMRISNTGGVGINTTGTSFQGYTTRLTVAADPNTDWLARWAGKGGAAWNVFTATLNSDPDGHTTVGSGNPLAIMQFHASDGTAFRNAAEIQVQCDAAPATSTVPANILFKTTPAGTSQTPVERLRIDSTGAVIVKGNTANGQSTNIKNLTESTTIAAAATTDTAIQIPANALVLGVSVRVTTVIPTAATFTVTGTSSATVFNTAAVSTAATSTDPGTKAGVYYNATAQTIRITPNLTPGTATGVVRVTIHYIEITPPTS